MGVPQFVRFEPINQVTFGLVNTSVNLPKTSGLGLISFGFILGDIWAICCDPIVTGWSGCAGTVSTTWTAQYVQPITGWTLC